MSKQCRFYLLPSDVERLLDELHARVGFKLISNRSVTMTPIEMNSHFSEYCSKATSSTFRRVNCYLATPTVSGINMDYLPTRREWAILPSSEAIEFSGCDFDGSTLWIGRLYFQTDQLIGDAIWPKRGEFLQWADRVIQTARRHLERSKSLDAYLGKDAAAWEQNGGRFQEI